MYDSDFYERQSMRILITSGGTKVAVDPIRHIGNKSTGRFGAALAKQALMAGAEVIYLGAKNGKSPFTMQIDCMQGNDLNEIKALYEFAQASRDNYHEYHYQYFFEYADMLKQLIKKYKPDIVILAAAVSDYLVSSYSNEKIRSSNDLTLSFEKAPKIINQIKQWSPEIFLVGFKLLIDANDEELVAAAMKTMQQSDADIVIGNNLAALERGAHEVIIVEKSGEFKKIKEELALHIIKRVLKR